MSDTGATITDSLAVGSSEVPSGPPGITEAQMVCDAIEDIEPYSPDNCHRGLQAYSAYGIAVAAAYLAEVAGGDAPSNGGGSPEQVLRFEVTPQTPGLIGKPGIDVLTLNPGTIVMEGWWFAQEPWDGNNATLYIETDLYPDLTSFGIYEMNDWQNDGQVSTGDYLLSGRTPKLWTKDDTLRMWVGDDQDGSDPGSSTGLTVVTLRVQGPFS